MSTVLVTGGTGALGTELVPRLVGVGHIVRVLSRRAHQDTATASYARGDLRTGEGLLDATSGVDVIAHLASGTGGLPSYKKAKRTDVDGTSRLLEAASSSGRPHVVYISIVGVDKIPFGYYRAKLDTERVIHASGLPHTILRTTQWHTLAWEFCQSVERSPVIPVPRGFASQVLDVGEVADRMSALVSSGPAGRVDDMGGPEPLPMTDIVRRYLNARGKRRLVVSVPIPTATWRAFAEGHNLAPDHADGRITWDEYLAKRVTATT